jgi:hypothetical protein
MFISIAIDEGVPLPETCVIMAWKEKTHFYWLKSLSGVWYLVNKCKLPFDDRICYRECNRLPIENSLIYDWVMVVAAPQMQKIAEALPPKIIYESTQMEFVSKNNVIGYDGDYKHIFETHIVNHHYAQAFAELYNQLKNEGLIE